MSSITGRSPTGHVWAAGFKTQQHPESCYLQTRLLPCYFNLWGFLQSNLKMPYSSQTLAATLWTFLNLPGMILSWCWGSGLPNICSDSYAPLLWNYHFNPLLNIFPTLEKDINCAQVSLVLMNAVNLPTIKGALKHRRSTGCLCHGDSWSQRRRVNPRDLNTLWTPWLLCL